MRLERTLSAHLMTEAMIQLMSYGFLVRTIVEAVQAARRIENPRAIKALVFVVSAIFVFVFGVDPSEMFGLGVLGDDLMAGTLRAADVTLLAGAAMGTHDILDMIAKKK